MKNFLLFLAFLLVGCAPVSAGALAPLGTPGMTNTPKPSATVTLVPSATPNAKLTEIYLNQILLDQERQKIELQIKAAELTEESSHKTETPMKKTLQAFEDNKKTSTAFPPTATQQKINQDFQSTREAIALEREANAVYTARMLSDFGFTMAWLVGIAVCVFLAGWGRYLWTWKREPEEVVTSSGRMRIDIVRNDGRWQDWTALPLGVTDEIYREVIYRLKAGLPYTETKMTGKNNPLIKDGTFDTFGRWMVDNSLACEDANGRYHMLPGAVEAMDRAK